MTETPRTADEGLGPGEVRRVRADWQIADERPICPDPSAHAEAAQDAARQRDEAFGQLIETARIILINEVPSAEAWQDFEAAYDAALRATEGKQPPDVVAITHPSWEDE